MRRLFWIFLVSAALSFCGASGLYYFHALFAGKLPPIGGESPGFFGRAADLFVAEARASEGDSSRPGKEEVGGGSGRSDDGKVSGQDDFSSRLVAAALERTEHAVVYDPSYVKLAYPGGDVPEGTGVCADVIVRVYRKVGIDLQVEVHEDMKKNFKKYPKKWGLKRPDSNIDHRRVYNLMTFFERKGTVLPVTEDPADYKPGDLVTWDLAPNLPHIGIVTDRKSADGKRNMVVHNIGAGPKLEDMLFDYKITGHYRYPGTQE